MDDTTPRNPETPENPTPEPAPEPVEPTETAHHEERAEEMPPSVEEPPAPPSFEGPEPENKEATAPPPPPYTEPVRAKQTPPPSRGLSSGWAFAIGCLSGCVGWAIIGLFALFIIGIIAAAVGTSSKTGIQGGDRVALIRVSGVISGGRGGSDLFSTSAGAERIIEQLEQARNDDSIRAVVLRINSPGGSAAGSEEVYNEIMRVRRDRKPVVTSMADMAASGGYYIACASDEIVCDAATLTGSIGVIMEFENYQKLLNKIGLDVNVIKSGKHKDIGSPTRPMTPEERQMLQSMVNNIFQQFVRDVARGRQGKLTLQQVKSLATGRVFTGSQAVNLKLADRIGGLHDAVLVAGKRAGIQGEPTVKEIGKPSFWDFLDSGSEDSRMKLSREVLSDPRMLELYKQLLSAKSDSLN